MALKSEKFDLKGTTASLAAGQAQTLKLKLSGKAKKLVKKAIKEQEVDREGHRHRDRRRRQRDTSPKLKIKVKK